MKNELLKGLTDEQLARIKDCQNSEEILKLAKEEGIELTDDQLEAVNGGFCVPDGDERFPNKCPKCGSTNTKFTGDHDIGKMAWHSYECLNCGHEYRIVKSAY